MRVFFFFKQKTAYEMRISDWSSDVCSSDLAGRALGGHRGDRQLTDAALVVPGQVAGVLPHRGVDVGLPRGVVDRLQAAAAAGTVAATVAGGRLGRILVGVGAGIRVARLGAVEARREVLVVGVLVLLCRLGTVVTAERRARVGLVSPVARAVPGLGEGATPARRAGVVVVGVVQEIEQRRGVAHLQAPGHRLVEVVTERTVILGVAHLPIVARFALVVEIHAAEGGVVLDPPQVLVVIVDVVAGSRVLLGVPGADAVDLDLALDRRIVVQRLGYVGHRTPGEDPERVSGAGGMRRLDDRLRALGRVRPAIRRADRAVPLLGDRGPER